MTRRYSTTSVETTLSASVSSTATTITVASSLGLIPTAVGFVNGADTFAIAIDPDTAQEEICWVTSVDNTTKTLTIQRGKADTTGIAHANGATVKHVLTGEDMKYIISQTDDSVKLSTVAAKGDLYAGTANDTVGILTAGANERRLVTDSTQTTGLKYVADTTNYAINAKGDLLAGTAADTLQAVTVGTDGATLVADSTATPGVSWTGAQIAKNYITNGDFCVTERNNSESPTTSAKFPVDRFFTRRSTGSDGLVLCYRTTDTPPDGFSAIIRMLRASTSTTTATLYIGQTIETLTASQLAGKTVTFSFYARRGTNYSATSNALQVRVYTGTGTDETGLGTGYTGTATPISGTATLTTSWQRFSFTATLATTVKQIQATLQYTPVGTASSSDYFDATGFQLEVGSVATPFVRAGGGMFGDELILCRRFFENVAPGTSYGRFGNGYATSSTTAKVMVPYKVTKRANPSSIGWGFVGLLNAANDTVYGQTSFGFDQLTKENVNVNVTASSASFTTGGLVQLVANNSSSAYVYVDAEIG